MTKAQKAWDAELVRQRRKKRNWWRKNRSKAALAKKALKESTQQPTNGHADKKITELIKAYQALHGATNDGQIKDVVTNMFVTIIASITK